MKVVQSNGLGVESAAILTEYLENPGSRDFPLEDLIVMTMQPGDELPDIKRLTETHLFPLLRAARVRFVELARAGPYEEDGIKVLEDTREPYALHIEGAYRLSDELLRAGTVPAFTGARRCSLKFKAWVGERWLAQEFAGEPYRHVFGYNADEQTRIAKSETAMAKHRLQFGFNVDEQDRIAKARQYDRANPDRHGEYPLDEWGWTREFCEAHLALKWSSP